MKGRKLFSGVLAGIMLLTSAQIPVFAEAEQETEKQYEAVKTADTESDVISSGTCGENGENLVWELRSDGTLEISGSGEMVAIPSWLGSLSTSIKKVIIGNDVTTIGSYGFGSCKNLTEVIIGNSVTKIGGDAFYGCEKLENITIPSSVTEIDDGAFSECDGLESIHIPSSVTKIGSGVIQGCENLKSIWIGSGLQNIEAWAFSDCPSLQQIEVDESNPYFCVRDGVLFNKDMTNLICYPAAKSDISYQLPDGVTQITEGAFTACGNLENVTLPDSMSEIGDSAFNRCYSLTSISIPESICRIGEYTFESCSGLESIVIPDHIKEIGYEAFGYCENLREVVIGDGISCISENAFVGCSNMESVTMESGITEIGYWAFDGVYMNVYYYGTEEEWYQIEKAEETGLENAVIHFVTGEMPQAMCDQVVQQISSAAVGNTITVNMENIVKVPQEIFASLQNKDVNLRLEFTDGTAWMIHGQNVSDCGQDVDVSLIRTGKTDGSIPADVINEISQNSEGEQISFSQSGDFGFETGIQFPVDPSREGTKAVFLQYENGAFALAGSGVVTNGSVSFDIESGDDYVLLYALNGDVSEDQSVNVVDLMQVLHHVSGRNEMNVFRQGIADIDLNQNVNVVDLMRMLHYVSGRSTTLSMFQNQMSF